MENTIQRNNFIYLVSATSTVIILTIEIDDQMSAEYCYEIDFFIFSMFAEKDCSKCKKSTFSCIFYTGYFFQQPMSKKPNRQTFEYSFQLVLFKSRYFFRRMITPIFLFKQPSENLSVACFAFRLG